MPLPTSSLLLHGGCNCRAIRYKISVPALADRPLHPCSDGKVPLPMLVIDHCNDCRRATGALLPLWICTPIAFVAVSCIARSSSSLPGTADNDADREWSPAEKVFGPDAPGGDNYLSTYESSEGVTRTFCARCGTNLTYLRHPLPKEWPMMLDMLLGTVDRDDLDTEAAIPERHLWWNWGVGWIKRLVSDGDNGLPKHPSYRPDETVE
ncbi:hypothetical protein MMC19_002967 [Ptychographa xylographoides]|nr:hypothetical protein [Ptychographa xylographoides]